MKLARWIMEFSGTLQTAAGAPNHRPASNAGGSFNVASSVSTLLAVFPEVPGLECRK